MQSAFTFNFDDSNDKIVIQIENSSNNLCSICHVLIVLIIDDKKYYLEVFDIQESLSAFKNILIDALNNKLQFPSSINQDIGYMFNAYMYYRYQENNINLELAIVYDENEVWVGKQYLLWGDGSVTSWMYNNINGDIIFALTPVYPEDESESFNEENFMQWMEQYKPLYIKEISKSKIIEWLDTANVLMQEIEASFVD